MEASPVIPEAIRTLIQSFEFHQAAYKRGQFNETQLRREFIDPFFKALGWDIDNNKRYSELYKEVIHEDPIRIRGSTEFIDYTFRIGGARKFIVEAKKPGVNIKDDSGPALQIRRYAWNARLPLSILTDFEEFAVYDCTKKPMPGDTAATARIAYFTYKEYSDKWGWIASIFSQDSILQGSFDRFAEGTKGKKGTATVDEAILADIEEWRDALAKNLALRNPALTVDELNVAVQRTIDRILFLRICEDRSIEQYGCLQQLLDGQDVYQRLIGLFQRADTKYNSGIFHFAAESGWDELPDTLTPGLTIDDAVLKKIIKRLYYPESPYEFSVISPIILGQVYEQFLGKVIRLTSGHQARVEYKPEVKKAGGVYYTPQYIVDYIVKHTVGELVKDKTPREAAKLRILDPACGSGSFLIGAYQYLLDWHLEYYVHNLVPVLADNPATSSEVQAHLPEPIPKSGKKKSVGDTSLPIYKSGNGSSSRTRSDWKLTTAERKRVLLNNIYGVDIDTQAVEVTKLSLLLKVLEEENEENVSKQLKLFDERALPSLHQNIKCGNSLIGTEIYSDIRATLEDSEEVKRINAFDWEREFPAIMGTGGFDVIIGNPPYGVPFSNSEIEYLLKSYQEVKKYPDSYCLFIVKGIRLLKKDGCISYIVPNTFCDLETCEEFRCWLLDKISIKHIWQTGWAFKSAIVDTLVFFIQKRIPQSGFMISVQLENNSFLRSYSSFQMNQKLKIDYRNSDNDRQLMSKISKISLKLKELASVKAGVILYEKGKGKPPQTETTMITKPFTIKGSECPIGWRPLHRGGDITRYFLQNSSEYVHYGPWLAAQRDPDIFISPKIIIRRTDDRILACLEEESAICVKSCHIIHLNYGSLYSNKYVLGIINSRLIQHIFELQNPQMIGKVFAEIKLIYVENLPIRTIDFSDPTDKARHDKMVTLVERMLSLNKQRADVKTDHDKNLVERQIEATDKQIDALVYELYGLTSEEIQIVEGVGK